MSQAPVLPWDDRLTTGMPELDRDHKILVDLMNQLGSSRAEGADEASLNVLLAAFRQQVMDHFAREAEMMARHIISEAHRSLHLKAHQGFLECIDHFAQLSASAVVDHLLSLLGKWLAFHVSSLDRQLVKEIKSLTGGGPSDSSVPGDPSFEETLVASMGGLYHILGQRTVELMTANDRLAEAHSEAMQAQQQLGEILAALDNVVWSIKPGSYETLYLNSAAEKVYGHAVAAFFQDPGLWLNTVHPEDRQRVSEVLAELMRQGVMDIEYRIVRADGEVRWIHDHMHAIIDEHGQAVSFNGLGTDITQSKEADLNLKMNHTDLQEAYRKLQEAQSQLLQSEKMASIGQLAAGVAHEINNPIGYVYSNLGSLQKYLDDLLSIVAAYENIEPLLAEHPEALADIVALKKKIDLDFLKEDLVDLMGESREGITRVKKIVQNLKDFSHAGSDEEWQLADLHQGIDSTLSIVWNEIKYKAEVKKEYGEIEDLMCLPSQLNQVFMNLLVNAAHAITDKGLITIQTGMEGDQIWVKIIDTGQGIKPEHLSRVFDPFFTTKPVGKGTGLGLSVSYSIIQTHHGSIEVTSEVGHGTTFTLRLPLRQPEASPATAANPAAI